MKLYSTAEIASIIGITPGRVRQICLKEGIGQKIGRDRVFTEEDLAVLRGRNTKSGRPWH